MNAHASLRYLAAMMVMSCGAQAEGLNVARPADLLPQWQARMHLGSQTLGQPLVGAALESSARNSTLPGNAALLGDYYFSSLDFALPSTTGRFRATSGLLFNARNGSGDMVPAAATRTTPLRPVSIGQGPYSLTGAAYAESGSALSYLGIGYTGLSLKGGWGFSADLGLTAESLRFGRALFGSQGFNAALRESRLSPVFQLGVSYAY